MAQVVSIPTHPLFQDITGRRFGRLHVVVYAGKRGRNHAWLCRCKCGNEKVMIGLNLKYHGVKTCGCKHNHSHRGSYLPEYRTWGRIRRRCYDTKDGWYHRYGGRGLRVCRRWRRSFAAFFADIGKRPSKTHSIGRKNNDQGYNCGKCYDCRRRGVPANCEWQTPEQQSNNTSRTRFLTKDGVTLSVAQWARRLKINEMTIRGRLTSGKSAAEALHQ